MAGGQATNAGIDYQQRVAAWCLINQFAEFDISIFFDQLDEEFIIGKTYFETDEAIDDLNLLGKNHKRIFLQIKRSLSLSTRETSDFFKTTNQFVNEFIKNEKTENYFGLITTSDASSKITSDLKKITLSIRLNSGSFKENPLNESEADTLSKFQGVFTKCYEAIKKKKPEEETFHAFAERIFIGVIDIEAGHSIEIASNMLLKSIGYRRPELIWSILIKNSLTYAKERLSVDSEKLKGIFERYLDEEKNKSEEEEQSELLKTQIINQGTYSAGKEVLFIESFMDELDYMIVELYRFKDDCEIKNTFFDNKIEIGNGDTWTVIQRFATMSGLERFMDENHQKYEGEKVAIIPANEIETVEDSECSKLHSAHLENLINKNENPLICLHCGKQVGSANSLLVEIEDRDTPSAVGSVHKECLRPIDRILGTIGIPQKNENKHLESFDFKLWVKLIMKGQGMLNALKDSPNILHGRTPLIAWNSEEEYDPDYSYCIKFILEDGSTSYSYHRSRIQRLNKPQAKEHLELFNSVQKKQREENNPWCVLSVSRTAAPYSEVIKLKKTEDEILEIESAEITKYSKLIAKAFDKDLFHYAPLCLVKDKEEETFVNLSNVVPLISDPLQISTHYDNWKKIGFELDDIELKIIKSDKDFDYYMRMIFGDGMVPIIDPLFDKDFQLLSGYPVQEYQRMVERMENERKK